MPASPDQVLAGLVAAITAALDSCDPPRQAQPGVFAGPNLPDLLAMALTEVAAARGGTAALVRHRPGCWEAEHVVALAASADWR